MGGNSARAACAARRWRHGFCIVKCNPGCEICLQLYFRLEFGPGPSPLTKHNIWEQENFPGTSAIGKQMWKKCCPLQEFSASGEGQQCNKLPPTRTVHFSNQRKRAGLGFRVYFLLPPRSTALLATTLNTSHLDIQMRGSLPVSHHQGWCKPWGKGLINGTLRQAQVSCHAKLFPHAVVPKHQRGQLAHVRGKPNRFCQKSLPASPEYFSPATKL